MLIVGERINTSRKAIHEAVERRDQAFIQTEVKAQVEAGADLIDVNAGSRVGTELEDLLWLIEVIQEVVPARLSLDSSDARCLKEAIRRVNTVPMLNSTNAEKVRFEAMMPVILEKECDIVALCMDERGVPKTVDQTLENAETLVKDLEALGVKRDRIYLDPLIQALSTNTEAGLMAMKAIERIEREFNGVNTICGLSNISYGLPKRSVINRAFLTLAMGAGLSAALIDPLDKKLMGMIKTTDVLLGRDAYCMNYIQAFRARRLED